MFRLEPMERVNLGFSASAVAAGFVLAPPEFAGSMALGAALEAVNFRALYQHSRALFAGQVAGGSAWVGLLGARFAVLGGGIVAALAVGANPVGLVVGLSLAMPATLIAAWLYRPPILPADSLPALSPDDPSWDRYRVWRAREVEVARSDEDDDAVGEDSDAARSANASHATREERA
jgi:hypothetical protein